MPGCFSILSEQNLLEGSPEWEKQRQFEMHPLLFEDFALDFLCCQSLAGQAFLPCFASCDFVWVEGMEKTVDKELGWKTAAGWSRVEVLSCSGKLPSFHHRTRSLLRAEILQQGCFNSHWCQKISFPLGVCTHLHPLQISTLRVRQTPSNELDRTPKDRVPHPTWW